MQRFVPPLVLCLSIACTSAGQDGSSGQQTGDTALSGHETGDSGHSDDSDTQAPEDRDDPFGTQDDTSEGLVNQSESLREVLEWGALQGACDAYAADPTDRRKELLCGKSMFFYESFGTEGVPRELADILLASFPEVLGEGFSELGLVPDPFSVDGYPLGLAPSDDGESLVFTCASCHFAPLPDGSYAVGAPNHDYEYGKHNIVLATFPSVATGELVQSVSDEAEAYLQPLLEAYQADIGAQLQLIGWMTTMIGEDIPEFSEENQRHYLSWKAGTMDFFIEPLPIDDGVHTVSKISALWGIPDEGEVEDAGMVHAMLGHTGNTRSLNNFSRQFAALGGGDAEAWGPDEVAPLVAYIESLRPPTPEAYNEAAASRGEDLFFEAGCIDCHSGPRGSGLRLYDFEEVETDDALRYWMDPEGDGTTLPDVDFGDDTITNQIKSPRLVGLWTMERYLHNGSIESLEELLCLEGDREPITEHAMTNEGHTFGCDSLGWDEKEDLLAYLRSH